MIVRIYCLGFRTFRLFQGTGNCWNLLGSYVRLHGLRRIFGWFLHDLGSTSYSRFLEVGHLGRDKLGIGAGAMWWKWDRVSTLFWGFLEVAHYFYLILPAFCLLVLLAVLKIRHFTELCHLRLGSRSGALFLGGQVHWAELSSWTLVLVLHQLLGPLLRRFYLHFKGFLLRDCSQKRFLQGGTA